MGGKHEAPDPQPEVRIIVRTWIWICRFCDDIGVYKMALAVGGTVVGSAAFFATERGADLARSLILGG